MIERRAPSAADRVAATRLVPGERVLAWPPRADRVPATLVPGERVWTTDGPAAAP